MTEDNKTVYEYLPPVRKKLPYRNLGKMFAQYVKENIVDIKKHCHPQKIDKP